MKALRRIVAVLCGLLLGTPLAASGNDCGLLPIPGPHCMIGRCIDGEWEQVCPDDPFSPCGIKPIPAYGCEIRKCVEGRWQEVCDGVLVMPEEPVPCGIKPLPPGGCYVGECVYGRWEMICF